MRALEDISKGAITDETKIENPLWAINDNLNLAQQLVDAKRFDSARFALGHAQKNLQRYESGFKDAIESPTRNTVSDVTRKLDAKISVLKTELEKKDPTMLQKASQTIGGWEKEVKSWF